MSHSLISNPICGQCLKYINNDVEKLLINCGHYIHNRCLFDFNNSDSTCFICSNMNHDSNYIKVQVPQYDDKTNIANYLELEVMKPLTSKHLQYLRQLKVMYQRHDNLVIKYDSLYDKNDLDKVDHIVTEKINIMNIIIEIHSLLNSI